MSNGDPVAATLADLSSAGWWVEDSEPGAFAAGAPGSSNGAGEWVAFATGEEGGLVTGQSIVANQDAFAAILTVLESSRGALPPGLDYSGHDHTPLPGRPLVGQLALTADERGWAPALSIPDSWSWRWGTGPRPRALAVVLGSPPQALIGASCRFIVHFGRLSEMRALARALTVAWLDRQAKEQHFIGVARMTARYRSRCAGCGSMVLPGDPIFLVIDHWMHYECALPRLV